MIANHTRKRSAEAGYSLAEMLTVIAIIGVVSLVTIPSFISIYKTSKMKASVRTFASDIRAARTLSISKGVQCRIMIRGTAKNGDDPKLQYNARKWDIQQGDSPTTVGTWTDITGTTGKPSKYLEDIAFFNTTGTDTTLAFRPDGTVILPAGKTEVAVNITTDQKVAQQSYTITISPSGRVLTK